MQDRPKTADDIRLAALDRIERSERWFKRLLIVAGIVETITLATLVMLMDFGDRLHLLVMVSAFLVYWTLAIWTWALAAHSNSNVQRVLRAVDMLYNAVREEPSSAHSK